MLLSPQSDGLSEIAPFDLRAAEAHATVQTPNEIGSLQLMAADAPGIELHTPT
jgi:hypothetical protein